LAFFSIALDGVENRFQGTKFLKMETTKGKI